MGSIQILRIETLPQSGQRAGYRLSLAMTMLLQEHFEHSCTQQINPFDAGGDRAETCSNKKVNLFHASAACNAGRVLQVVL
ncbi:hypothetical protein FKM82_019116 [Ascaphus truei]